MKHLLPTAAWELLQAQPEARLIDVRMEIESLYVGRPPGAINVPWYEYPDLTPNPDVFVKAVVQEVGGLGEAGGFNLPQRCAHTRCGRRVGGGSV